MTAVLDHRLPLIGVDLGGTKIEVAVLAPDGRFVLRTRAPTPQGDYVGTLNAIADLVAKADATVTSQFGELTSTVCPVGVAIPGSLSPVTGCVRNANSTVLNGARLLEDLAARLDRPVRIDNDANCLAASECADGAAAGASVTFSAILGTGVGAGLAWGRSVWSGLNRVAGEWGHNPLPWLRSDWDECSRATPCWCGKSGCIETWLSGPGLARDFERLGGPAAAAPSIVTAMRSGDDTAKLALERYGDRLARALAQVINLLDPSVIVLGGGMSQVDEIYQLVPERLSRYVFADASHTPVRRAQHGDSSGVRGAAWLWAA